MARLQFASLRLVLVRNFSCAKVACGTPHGTPPSAVLRLPRSLIAIHGPDSNRFLNGLITTRPPEPTYNQRNVSQFAAMLNAKGRVIADIFVYPAHDNPTLQKILAFKHSCYILDIDSLLIDKILSVLDFHILLSDVEISVLKDYNVYSLWNDEQKINLLLFQSALLWSEDNRAPGFGHRLIGSEDCVPLDFCSASLDEYKLRRYLFGIPEGSEELTPNKALPLDSCIDYMGGIDFNKGCYMGQELTIRTQHHGNVRKRIMPVVFTNAVDEILPDELYVPKELAIEQGSPIHDRTPVPHSDIVAPIFGLSPFNSKTEAAQKRQRPAGEVIASLGNVGLAKLRVDTLGHDFRIQDLYVKPLTPFWWPRDPNE